MLTEVIGTLAIITSAVRVMPQIIKTYKIKRVRDVSLTWEFVGVVSTFLWLWYALLNNDLYLTIGGGILFLSYVILVIQNFIYGKK